MGFAAAAMVGHEFRRLICQLDTDIEPVPVIKFSAPQTEVTPPQRRP